MDRLERSDWFRRGSSMNFEGGLLTLDVGSRGGTRANSQYSLSAVFATATCGDQLHCYQGYHLCLHFAREVSTASLRKFGRPTTVNDGTVTNCVDVLVSLLRSSRSMRVDGRYPRGPSRFRRLRAGLCDHLACPIRCSLCH